MSSRKQEALDKLSKGYDCSRAILSTYAPHIGLSAEEVKKYAGSRSVLPGKPQEVCGAVQGAIRVIQLKMTHRIAEPVETSEIEELTDRFRAAFVAKNGAINCSELLGTDLSTYEGQFKAMEEELDETKCASFLADAVDILEQLLVF